MAILPKAVYGFNAICTKLPMTSLTELKQIILIFIWNYRRSRIAKEILKTKNKAGRHDSPRFQIILQSCSNKNSMVLSQRWNRIENSEIDPRHLWSINLWQRRQEYTMEKRWFFNKWCWESRTGICKSMKLEYSFLPYTKMNSKWFKDLNIIYMTS